MSRYTLPIRFRFEGDKAKAQQFIPAARTVVGTLLDSGQLGQTTMSQTRNVARGVVVRAQVFPDVVIATITYDPALAAPPRSIPPTGFVTKPLSATWPDGQDADKPQAIITAARGAGPTVYNVAYSTDSPTGPWTGLRAPKSVYTPRYPAGVKQGGEVDWIGPRGDRLSWYGPQSRYFYDPNEQAINLFPIQLIFHRGQQFFYTDQYALDQGNPLLRGGVMGAAVYHAEAGAKYLHVVQKNAEDGITRLVRYLLATGPGGTYVTSTYQILWEKNIADSRTPWFFSASGLKAVHFTDPFNGEFGGDAVPAESHVEHITINPDDSVTNTRDTISYNSQDRDRFEWNPRSDAVPVAADYIGEELSYMYVVNCAKELNLVGGGNPMQGRPYNFADIGPSLEPPNLFFPAGYLIINGRDFLIEHGGAPVALSIWATEKILYVDIRHDFVISVATVNRAVPNGRVAINLWRAGQLVHRFFLNQDSAIPRPGSTTKTWEPSAFAATSNWLKVAPRLTANAWCTEVGDDPIFGTSFIPHGWLESAAQGLNYFAIAYFDAHTSFDELGRMWTLGVAADGSKICASLVLPIGDNEVDGSIGTSHCLTGSNLVSRTNIGDNLTEFGTSTTQFLPIYHLGLPIF